MNFYELNKIINENKERKKTFPGERGRFSPDFDPNHDEDEHSPHHIFTNLNMTRKLPVGTPLATLNRKFHVNTIISRLYGHWVLMNSKKTDKPMIPPQWELADNDGMFPPNPYRNKDGSPTNKYYAAYKVWEGYIKDIVASIPSRDAKDVHTGKEIDFLEPTRNMIGKGQVGTEIVEAIKTAAEIEEAVFGSIHGGKARDYANLMEILADIFDDPKYEDAARDFREIGSGSRELPSETIEKLISDNPNAEIIDGPNQ
jgi:hypothetical protein